MKISRRKWIKTAAAVPSIVSGEPSRQSVSARLDIVLENRSFLALSSDNRSISTYAFGTNQKYRERSEEKSTRKIRPIKAKAIVLSRLGDSDALVTLPIENYPFPCEFFYSSGRLLAQVPLFRRKEFRHELILMNIDASRGSHVSIPKHLEKGYYFAIKENRAVCKFYTKVSNEGDIFLVDYVTGKEFVKVPFLPGEKIVRDLNPLFDLIVSADRSFFVYQVADLLICRETDNLTCRWIWRIPDPMNIRAISISAKSDRIVVALLQNTIASLATECRIVLLSAEDRQVLTELPLNGMNGVAIHPNNNVVAMGRRVRLPDYDENYVLSVDLVNIADQRVIQSLYHTEVRGRRNTIASFFSRKALTFSGDGQHLIVSAQHVKIWKLEGAA